MASPFIVKNTILRVSKANLPSIPCISPSKLSRICFTSASQFHQNQYGREDAGGEETAKAAERIREARQVYEKDEEVERKYKEMKQSAKDAPHHMKEGVRAAKEKAGDTMDWTADKAKEGTGKAAEAVHNVGEKAKETAKGVWETAKDATHRLKEKVVGDDNGDMRIEDYMEDHFPSQGDSVRDRQTRHGRL